MASGQNPRRSKRIPAKSAVAEPVRRETYKWRGARYERSDDIDGPEAEAGGSSTHAALQSRKRPRATRKDEYDGESLRPAQKKARISGAAVSTKPLRRLQEPPAIISRREKTDETVADEDEVFRTHCLQQFEQVSKSGNKTQGANTAHILPFLKAMRPPQHERIERDIDSAAPRGEPPEAYVLTTAQAKSLLASNVSIPAPVFIPDGARPLFTTENGRGRPIEQLFSNCFVDEKELVDVYSSDKPKPVRMSSLRKHFLTANGPVDMPWNAPDISNPLADQATPDFLTELGSSNFFNEMMRRLLDVTEEEICQDSCKTRTLAGICCDEHRLTVPELTLLHDGWRCWRGTVMLADAGAATPGHYDKWALPTWISCYEGEVGFCWQSHPSDEERLQWIEEPNVPKGQYRFKVLRAGDTVYMPPGTVHHVFRLLEGRQTLCMAAHVLRRQRLDEWLNILSLDLERAVDRWDDEYYDEAYHCYVPGLVRIVRFLLGQAKTKRDVERFGGREVLAMAKKLAEKLHDLARRIEELAAVEAEARVKAARKTARARKK